MSDEDGFKIIENINNALENDELTIKDCPTRMQYLVKNIDRIDGEAVDDEGCCPFCGEPINEVYKSCENCGQKLRDISVMEKFSQDLGNFDINDFLDDFDHDKFSELLESDEFWGRVPIEENDSYFDLKTFYNETLTSFDFEEVKEFYDKSDKSMPIDKIFEDFFDDLIFNGKNEDVRFDAYKNFLVNYCYYYLDGERFNEALICFIQLLILASNRKSIFPGDIIERTPHAADITLALEQFSKHASDYNLDECLDNAFATFKVDKWNNNRQEIYEIMHHYL